MADTIITRCNSQLRVYRFNSQTYTFNSSARTRVVGGERALGSRKRTTGRSGGGSEREEFKQSTTHGE